MALTRNTKLADRKVLGDRVLYTEIVDTPAVDDVVNFMAHSEMTRRLHAIFGEPREVQVPSDELKEALLEQLES